jgi:uncharacterized Rmd1/YagE family protein
VQKIGPQRTTKTAQKLKILPSPDHGDEGPDEESGKDVYAQYTRIKDPTARRDAARLGKADRERLPRVTAYCTAESYRMDEFMVYMKRKLRSKGTAPKRYDECIYCPYRYDTPAQRNRRGSGGSASNIEHPPMPRGRRYSDSALEVENSTEQRREDLIDLHTSGAGDVSFDTGIGPVVVPNNDIPSDHDEIDTSLQPTTPDFLDTELHTPEIFLFNYGALVVWGMTVQQEKRFLKEASRFEVEKMEKSDIQSEEFNFYFTTEYEPRIYNDFISLNGLNKKDHMTRLAISHALAQSVKTSLYEELAFNTIESTKTIPSQIALTGKVRLSPLETNMEIGQLFLLKINIHLQGSILDAPELLWSEPQLEPVYKAARDYLEMDQRVTTLTQRLDVIADLLSVLKGQLSRTHEEFLEWIGEFSL